MLYYDYGRVLDLGYKTLYETLPTSILASDGEFFLKICPTPDYIEVRYVKDGTSLLLLKVDSVCMDKQISLEVINVFKQLDTPAILLAKHGYKQVSIKHVVEEVERYVEHSFNNRR